MSHAAGPASTHPATLAWWQRRDQCAACSGAWIYAGREGETVMRCRFVPRPVIGDVRGRVREVYCIDARSPGGPCGPEAALFQAKR